MKLPALNPLSWGDLTLNFQALQSWLAKAGDIDTGGQAFSIRRGTQTLSWDGTSPVSTVTTVTHGLGTTPAAITFGPGPLSSLAPRWETRNNTMFTMTARDVTGTPAAGTIRDVDWIAVS